MTQPCLHIPLKHYVHLHVTSKIALRCVNKDLMQYAIETERIRKQLPLRQLYSTLCSHGTGPQYEECLFRKVGVEYVQNHAKP